MTESSSVSSEAAIIEHLRSELAKSEPTRRRRIIEMFVLAALGSIPWVGGFLSAAASYKINDGSLIQDSLQTQWLEEHHKKIFQQFRVSAGDVGSPAVMRPAFNEMDDSRVVR